MHLYNTHTDHVTNQHTHTNAQQIITTLECMDKAFAALESSFFESGLGKAANMMDADTQDSAVAQDRLRIKTLISEAERISREAYTQAQEAP